MMLSPLEELRDRANAEYTEFCGELLQQAPEEILEQAYKKVILEDFLSALEGKMLSPEVQHALCNQKYPLESLYQEWLGNEYSHMDLLCETAEDFAQHKAPARVADMAR